MRVMWVGPNLSPALVFSSPNFPGFQRRREWMAASPGGLISVPNPHMVLFGVRSTRPSLAVTLASTGGPQQTAQPTAATLTPPLGPQHTAQARGHARPNNNHYTWPDNSRTNSCLSFHFIDWIYRGNRYRYTHPFPLSPSAIATDMNDSDAISPWAT